MQPGTESSLPDPYVIEVFKNGSIIYEASIE